MADPLTKALRNDKLRAILHTYEQFLAAARDIEPDLVSFLPEDAPQGDDVPSKYPASAGDNDEALSEAGSSDVDSLSSEEADMTEDEKAQWLKAAAFFLESIQPQGPPLSAFSCDAGIMATLPRLFKPGTTPLNTIPENAVITTPSNESRHHRRRRSSRASARHTADNPASTEPVHRKVVHKWVITSPKKPRDFNTRAYEAPYEPP